MPNISKWKTIGNRLDALKKQGVIAVYPDRIQLTDQMFKAVSVGKSIQTTMCAGYIRKSFNEDDIEIIALMDTEKRLYTPSQETLFEAKMLTRDMDEESRYGFIYASDHRIQIEKEVMFASFFPEKKENEARVQDGEFTIFAAI